MQRVLRLPQSCYDPGAFHIMRRAAGDNATGSGRRGLLAAEVLNIPRKPGQVGREESERRGLVPRGCTDV